MQVFDLQDHDFVKKTGMKWIHARFQTGFYSGQLVRITQHS